MHACFDLIKCHSAPEIDDVASWVMMFSETRIRERLGQQMNDAALLMVMVARVANMVTR